MGLIEMRRRLLLLAKKIKNLIGEITNITYGWISSSGTISTSSDNVNRGMILQPIPVEPNTTYTFSWNGVQPYSMSACEYTDNNEFIVQEHQQIYGTSPIVRFKTITTRSNCAKVVLQYYRDYVSDPSGVASIELIKSMKPMMEIGNQLTPYEP